MLLQVHLVPDGPASLTKLGERARVRVVIEDLEPAPGREPSQSG